MAENSEGIGDIQNYLADFNPKDISKTEPSLGGEDDGLGSVSGAAGQYFVDQETGQYYFQSSTGEMVQLDADQAPEMMDTGDNVGAADHGVTKTDPSVASGAGLTNNQVVLSSGSGGDPYQTVTIVPNQENNGEVSYVLIVQQNEEEGDKKGGDMGEVYDFETENDPDFEADEHVSMDDKSKLKFKPTQVVSNGSNYTCNYCNYTTAKRYLLSRHMKSHSEERPHKCSVCERGFKTLASLHNHVNTHTGTKPHKCKYCEATFTTSGELVRHVRYRHTHEKPHKCPDCDYMSVELSKLKRHMRCHSGERPYQCPHCTYASPDTFKLKRHLRIHTGTVIHSLMESVSLNQRFLGEKPYECDICHARFTQSNSLKAHRTIHTGDKPVYQCELCPTTCGRKTDLRLHVQKLHTSEKPMHCKMCGKSFPDR